MGLLVFNISSIIMLMIFLAWVSIFYFRSNFLLALFSLEFAVLGLFMGVIMTLSTFNKPSSVSFYLLAFGACETSLALSLLVKMTRFSGADMLSVLDSSC